MKYKNDEDNRYRVRFMRATEELIDKMTIAEFISYLEKNGELEETDHDGTRYYLLRETPKLFKEFIVTADGKLFYWLSLLKKIELVDDIKIEYVVGDRYNLTHQYIGNIVKTYDEVLEKIVDRKDGKTELRFSGSRRTIIPISSKKQYGIIQIEKIN
jgi:hypothetical protein